MNIGFVLRAKKHYHVIDLNKAVSGPANMDNCNFAFKVVVFIQLFTKDVIYRENRVIALRREF